MTTGIILAGGRGSRMGPLAAQVSKALVTVGQQPNLVHQLQLMQKAEVERVVVVTSPDTNTQIVGMLQRAGYGVANIITATQEHSRGPVDAIYTALEVAPLNEDILILMSDTYLDEELPPGEWVGVGAAPTERSFCWFEPEKGVFHDCSAYKDSEVTIGAYRFADPVRLYGSATIARRVAAESGIEDSMSMLLNGYFSSGRTARFPEFKTWLDVGDIRSLAKARRSKFVSREHHRLELADDGILTKHGEGEAFERQIEWMREVNNDWTVSSLIPRYYGRLPYDGNGYNMEHVDLPTLSELWLYWPGRPDTWAGIVEDVVEQVGRLWKRDPSMAPYTSQEEFALYAQKAWSRVREYDVEHSTFWQNRVRDLIRDARPLFTGDEQAVFPHGDLNWNNILLSLNTGAVKLLDPRGDLRLPLSYEFAKMRYSYHGGFSAITHKLFVPMTATMLPERDAESEAIDGMIADKYGQDLRKLQACEGMLLLAGSTMHTTDEAEMLLAYGCKLLEEVR